jgi:uncharacterized membrane protein
MGAGFVAAGALHFVRCADFRPIMPRVLPEWSHDPLIYASGVAEVVCGVGLLRRRAWAVPAGLALLAAVFPANVQMALDAGSGRLPGGADDWRVAYGRLPFQAVMAWAVWQGRPAPVTAPG